MDGNIYPDISIVIPTFNRRDILFYCLRGLLNQTFPKDRFEVIIVDDGSTEDIKSLTEEFSRDLIINYMRQEKSGQARAENAGIKNARSEIILFMDNDMLAAPCLVEEHFRFHQLYNNIIVRGAYGNTSDYKNPESASEGIFHSTAFFIAGNVSIRKSDLIKAGMFDEEFKEYGWLDLELGMRLRNIGLSAITNKKAFAHHFQKNFEVNDLPSMCYKEIERGHTGVQFYMKHPCMRVRLATMNPLLLFVGRLLYGIDLMNSVGIKRILSFLYTHKINWLINIFLQFIAMAYYSHGVREGFERYKNE